MGSARGAGAEEAFNALHRQCGSGLERKWLETVRAGGFRLPNRAQPLLTEFSTQPDFAYDQMKALVYVDGPHHRSVAIKTVDDVKRSTLRDAGYKVVIFTDDSTSWPTVFGEFPFVFGKGNA
jgi:very-short-patch-repair endonuclease